ncbi:MAG TPA: hypothetical protein VEQ60_06925 [Longimicrobium sp.]|nr:hypothetical protein [Longimicrobium sp.]
MRNMMLDLNALAVESFETNVGDPEPQLRSPRVTHDIILCAVADTRECLAGSPTNEVILC